MSDSEHCHEALRSMFENICGAFDDGCFERRAGYDFIRFPRIPIALFNGVWPNHDDAAAALADALEDFDDFGLPCSVQVRTTRTPGSVEEARRLGFTGEQEMPGMIAREDDLAAPSVDGLEIAHLAAADVLQAMTVAAAGFGAPEAVFAPIYAAEMSTLDGIDYYLGRVGAEAVSTSIGYTVGDVVGVFNVATPPAHRGCGYGGALTAAAARGGFARGADVAFLQSSAMGFSVYSALGFDQVETYVLMTRP